VELLGGELSGPDQTRGQGGCRSLPSHERADYGVAAGVRTRGSAITVSAAASTVNGPKFPSAKSVAVTFRAYSPGCRNKRNEPSSGLTLLLATGSISPSGMASTGVEVEHDRLWLVLYHLELAEDLQPRLLPARRAQGQLGRRVGL
jgi:hypothetical protein